MFILVLMYMFMLFVTVQRIRGVLYTLPEYLPVNNKRKIRQHMYTVDISIMLIYTSTSLCVVRAKP
jgi:hypothetical protein